MRENKTPWESTPTWGSVTGLMGRPASICLWLALVTLAVYLPLVHAQFTGYDDPDYVAANPHVLGGITLQNLRWAFFTGHANNWHPLTWISLMLDCQFFGRNAGANHLVNVLFHIADTLLLFLWLNRVTAAKWRSALVAALFALHPLHVQSVAWISERKDVLSALFWMLTLWSYAAYANRRGAARYLLTLLLFALGLMTKPMLVTLPCVLLLIDYWPLKRFAERGKTSGTSRLVLEKIPFLLLSAASCVTTLVVQHKQAMVSTDLVPLPVRLANAVFAYVAYIGKMICPARLSVIYPYTLHPSFVQVGATGLSLALISIYAVVLGRRWPYLLTGWLWFLGTLVPVIGIVQVGAQAMADRYTYIPLIGLFIVAAWGTQDVFDMLKVPNAVRAWGAACMLAGCALVSRMQLPYWHDSIALFQHAIDTTANNDIAQINLGVALATEQRHEEAIAHYAEALEIQPKSPKAWNNLGLSLVAVGRLEDGIIAFQKAIHLNPAYADAHNNLATALARAGRLQEAIPQYEEALRLNPDDAGAQNNLAIVLGSAGQFDEALRHFSEAMRLAPADASIHYNLGNLFRNNNKPEQAMAEYTGALRLKPDMVPAHSAIAAILRDDGRISEAIQHYQAALKLKTDDLPSLNGLAWIYATCADANFRNSVEAIRMAEEASKLSGYKHWEELDTLAAAYANAERYPEALRTAHQALDLATGAGATKMAAAIQARIGLYGAGHAYREANTATTVK